MRLIVLLALGVALFPASAAGQSTAEPQILIISSYHPGYRWSDAVLAGIRETVLPRLPKARLYIEHLDTKRLYSETAVDFLAEMMRVKYQRIRFDALIFSDDNAIDFLRKYRWSLFRDIPAVFCGANDAVPARMLEMAPITGINEAADVRATIDLALTLLPATRQIVVVNDTTTTGRKVHQEIVDAATGYQERLEFIYWEELSFDDILERLARLTPGSIVLYTFFSQDNRGVFYAYNESAEAVGSASPVPVFGLWEFNLGHGIVGGKLVSGYAQGSAAAEQTIRILAGEAAAQIPILMQSPNRFAFDYRQVQRFGLNSDHLPPGSRIINRPVSLYAQHKVLILSVAAALCALTLLSGFLLVAIRRGRGSEARLRASQEFLTGITGNIPGVVYQFYATDDGRYGISYVSEKTTQLLGIEPNMDGFLENFAGRIHAADRDRFWSSIQEAVAHEATWHFEGRFIKASEETIWLAADSTPHRAGSRLLFDGVIVDITARKRRVEFQRQRLERFQRQQAVLIAMGNHTATIDGDVEGAIRFLTEAMAGALAVQRVGVWLLNDEGRRLTLSDGYDAGSDRHSHGKHLETALYPRYMRAQHEDWIIAATDALTDPRTEEFADGYLRPEGIGALLDSSVFVGGELVGIICHEHSAGPRAWHSDEISLARSASEFLARTILRAEHIRAQEALGKAERLWAQVINFLPDPTFAIDQDGRVIVWNHAVAELTGVATDQMLGKGDYAYALPVWGDRRPIMIDLVHQWNPETAAGYRDIVCKGDVLTSETIGLQVGSKTFRFRNTAGPLYDDAGNAIGAIQTVRDITASKKAEAELRSRQEFLESVLYHAPDAIITLDDAYRVVDWNPGAEQTFGYTRAESLGQPLGSLITRGDTGGESAWKASQIEKGERVEAFETVRYRKDGSPVQVISAGSPIMVEGKLTGAVAMFTDITGLKAAEEEIRQRERMLRRLMDIVPSMIFVKNAEGRFLMVNQAVADFYGMTVEQTVGRLHGELHPNPEEAQHSLAEDRQILEIQQPIRIIETFSSPGEDKTRWLETIKTPCGEEDFGEPAIVGLAMDITQRKQAEVALKEANQMLRLVLDTIPVRVFWKDRECRYLGCNQPFAEDAGKTSPLELLGMDDFSITWVPEAASYRRDDLAVMATGRSRIDYEETQTTPAGDKISVLTSKVPMRDEHGNITGVLGTYQDITERKAAENEVRRLRNYLANIINSMPSMLVGVDAQLRITQWNTQAEKLTGLPFEKVNAQPLEVAVPIFKDEMTRIQKAIRDCEVVHDPKVASQEEGKTRFQDITIYPLVANGVEGAVIRVDDVTERVRMEEMMIQSEKMLSVGGLAAGMAHEINNPLAGILQNASVLENRLLGELPANDRAARAAGTSMAAIGQYMRARKLPEMVASIRSSGDRAAAIVRNMLSFARKSNQDISPREMGALLDQTIELVSTDYDMKKQYDFKRIEIVREYDPKAPALPCEESKIQQVFLNILKNGAEAMVSDRDAGSPPRFILRVADEDEWVRVEIQDNGPGMPDAIRKRIFEPFFTTKEVGQGTGLGLSISYFIIAEDHGGKMTVTSELGGGTCFVIRLQKKRTEGSANHC